MTKEGGVKNAECTAEIFTPTLERLDPDKQLIDLFFFDGASNVQKAGQVLCERYPGPQFFMPLNMCCPFSLLMSARCHKFGICWSSTGRFTRSLAVDPCTSLFKSSSTIAQMPTMGSE
jgi:hypothetical protein